MRTKKTIYAASIILGLAVFAVVIVRTTYDPSFLTFGHAPTAQPFVSVEPFIASANADTEPAPSIAPTATGTAVQEVIASVPQSSFNITIPSISVDAHVEDVGVKASTGNIDTPKLLDDAAWYDASAVPGSATGTAVILGHVDNGLGLEGVFKDLKNLQDGSDVYVTDKDGTKVHYIVTNVTDYVLATAPVDAILHDPSGGPVLHIITCDKTWNGFRYHYDHRVVVTAVPVPQ